MKRKNTQEQTTPKFLKYSCLFMLEDFFPIFFPCFQGPLVFRIRSFTSAPRSDRSSRLMVSKIQVHHVPTNVATMNLALVALGGSIPCRSLFESYLKVI